jgi:hypothetical protein
VADVGAAASVRVAVSACDVPPVVGVGGPASVDVAGGTLAAAVARFDANPDGAVVREVLPPAAPGPLVLAGRLVVVRDVGRLVVVEVAGRGRAGGRMAGGLPAPNAHPSTVPLFGFDDAAPTVLYDQEPPGAACQYDQ